MFPAKSLEQGATKVNQGDIDGLKKGKIHQSSGKKPPQVQGLKLESFRVGEESKWGPRFTPLKTGGTKSAKKN